MSKRLRHGYCRCYYSITEGMRSCLLYAVHNNEFTRELMTYKAGSHPFADHYEAREENDLNSQKGALYWICMAIRTCLRWHRVYRTQIGM